MLLLRLRAVAIRLFIGCALGVALAAFAQVRYAVNNPDFEEGDLSGWSVAADGLTIEVTTNASFNRYHAARMHGSFAASRWVTNRLSQTFAMNAGDVISAIGFLWWPTQVTQSAQARGEIEVKFAGPIATTTNVWTNPTPGWVFFEVYGGLAGIMNGGFEAGTLENWMHGADHLNFALVRDPVAEGQYALRMYGAWTNTWSWNHVSQGMMVSNTEMVVASAKLRIAQLTKTGGWAVAGLKLEDEYGTTLAEHAYYATTNTAGWVPLSIASGVPSNGFYILRCFVCGSNQSLQADVYFDDVRAQRRPLSVVNGDFESADLRPWSVGTDHLVATVSTVRAYTGAQSLRMSGSWTNWSWNNAYQRFYFSTGAVVRLKGRLYLQTFTNTTGWAVAGLKLERQGGSPAWERVYDRNAPKGQWLDLSTNIVITSAGPYDLRCMVCGSAGSVAADVYFDAIQLNLDGVDTNAAPTGTTVNAELAITYRGWSGGAASTSRVDIYVDSVMVKGSSANPQPVYAAYEALRDRAAAIAADPAENDIPAVPYPPLYAYGYPGGSVNPVAYPVTAEIGIPSWAFKAFSNDVVLTLTNTLILAPLGGAGYVEVDQYVYCGRSWQTDRGAPLDLQTNAPYFVLGARDGQSGEFGAGPFPAVHTYVVGQPLANFPRRLVSIYDGQWPTRLDIVFQENLGQYDRTYDKHFGLYGVPTNGAASGTKSVWIELHGFDAISGSNLYVRSQEIHMGWAPESESRGMVDYPNCTYQDHNAVSLRAPWKYNLLDRDGWFVQPVPRGSATIEPIDVFIWESGRWSYRAYEEYLFTWPNAASGVRSVFDDDTVDALPGPASYFVGYKIGHVYGTNELGEPQFVTFIENRGNGYFRMTDHHGVMGGSFRPVSMDVFGLYQYEDAPLIPETYLSLITRTTASNVPPDDSFVQASMFVRSKTNQWLVGALNFRGYYVPEVTSNGVYFELESDLYANRAVRPEEHGALNVFAQVDMYWRGQATINGGGEAHDFDAVILGKADGEWITHYPINPPTNVCRRTLGTVRSNDVVYIMQQDRGADSYGFNPEAPYRKVSSMEITLLDDGGKNLSLDVYEQNTVSEISDNAVIACALNEDLAKGERVHTRYRYRAVYGPGVTVVNPNTPDGGDNWSNQAYLIEVYATDGDDRPLRVDLFYGNGRADDWKLINTNELLTVPQSTHKVSYLWNVDNVPPGAYYIRAEARRLDGTGRPWFDVSDSRLQVAKTIGLPNNVPPESGVVTNQFGYLGTNMSFETGGLQGWTAWADHLSIGVSQLRAWDGIYSCRMTGQWHQVGQTNRWSWNAVAQEIPCISGETLRVQGRIYISQLQKAGTNWLLCGIKMESTNFPAPPPDGQEFGGTYTSVWISVDFSRRAPVTGRERLLLWVGGYDASACDVFFDDIKVISTNQGTIVTNQTRAGYWASDVPVNASGTDVLAFHLAMSDPDPGLRVWVADANGVTNSTAVTNHVAAVLPVSQYVAVPWSSFPSVDRTQVVAMGFHSPLGKYAEVSGARFAAWPISVRVSFPYAPLTNAWGVPHYNPGQDVIQVLTVSNGAATPLSGVRLQWVQEYGETKYWWDGSHPPGMWSERTRRGDRLCGTFERNWTNVSLPAGGVLVLTNVYKMPEGKYIDHTRTTLADTEDWYLSRNDAAYAQIRLVVRRPDGSNVAELAPVALYSMDDDYDMDDDGLPDAWELQYGGCVTCMMPGADPDDDGYTNYQEYLGGSDPTDPSSYPGHVSSYVLHLAYTNGVDLFPRAAAEQSNYTAAACAWMIARYLNGESFTQSQTQIYAANTVSPEHRGEITPSSLASWMYYNAPPQFYFAARYRNTLEEALRESVYWMDYLPPGGKKTPVYIACGTNWFYKVVRGFETDRAPYDGGFGVTTGNVFTIYGLWLNDPAVNGLGYDVFVSASEMTNVYLPSEPDGRRWLVAEPPADPDERALCEQKIEGSRVELAEAPVDPALGARLRAAALGESAGKAPEAKRGGAPSDLSGILPAVLREDAAFMEAFERAEATNCYVVNLGGPDEYLLAAGGVHGPATTVFVIKLGTNGAFQAAAWSKEAGLYPPVSYEAARWLAFRERGWEVAWPENLLANPGFEENGGGPEPVTPTGWARGGAAGAYSWGARQGQWSMAVIGWDGTSGYFYQDVPGAVANAPYAFGLWIQKDTNFAANTVELKLEWFDASMTKLGEAATNVLTQLDGTYRFCRVDGVSPANTRTVRCTLWCGGIASGPGALKCDDARLVRATNAAIVTDARLVFDPAADASPFHPRWRLLVSLPSGAVTAEVASLKRDLDADTDDDGIGDQWELYVGSDPENAQSVFFCEAARAVFPTGVVLRWPSVANRTYAIWSATDLSGSFERRHAHIPATPPVNERIEPVPTNRVYYRIETE